MSALKGVLASASLLAATALPAAPADELVVTGTRLYAEEEVLPGAATVISREEIDARNDAVVTDLLRNVPGVHVNQAGAGGVPQLFIRGSEANFTVFLVDGIRVNDLNNTRGGSFDLASLSLAEVERVELVRGPQSSIYGSDGLAGVINFITRRGGEKLAATAEVEAGGDEYVRGTLRASGPAGRNGDFSIQASRRDDGEQVPGSSYEADTVSGSLRLMPSANLSASFHARFASTEGTSFPEQSGGPDLAVLRDLNEATADDFTLGADLEWALSDTWSVQALASMYDRSDEYSSRGIAPGDQVPPNGAANDLERENLALRATVRPAAELIATFGIDYQRESGKSDGYFEVAPGMRIPNSFSLDRDIVGIFAEGRYMPDRQWTFQASIRHDEPDEISGETTGRLGAVYTLPDSGTRLHANWGTGFKLPSFYALGSFVGNVELRPETARSWDVGITQGVAGGAAELSVTYFDNEFRHYIDFDPEAFKLLNRDRVTTNGVELAAKWSASESLELRAEATWTDIEIHEDGGTREALQRPEWRGSAGLRWVPADAWLLDIDWLYTGEVLDSSLHTGFVDLDAWHRVDVSLSWSVTPRLRLALAVDNLLDGDYEEAVGFPAGGIRPRLGARYLFGGSR